MRRRRERKEALVVCLGNPDRGDDAIGRRVAALLRERRLEGVEIVECDGEGTALLDALEGAGAAVVVDAAVSGAPAGTVRLFDFAVEPLPRSIRFGWSSHGLGPAEALALGRALGRLPSMLLLVAIEGEGFDFGAPLSVAAESGAVEAARRISAIFGSEPEVAAAAFSTDGKRPRPCRAGRKTLYAKSTSGGSRA